VTAHALVAFIGARLDEDEADARRASRDKQAGDEWHADPLPVVWGEDAVTGVMRDHGGVAMAADGHAARHIARYDPAAALAEVAFGRFILADHKPRPWHTPEVRARYPQLPDNANCSRCHEINEAARVDEDECRNVDWPCPTLRHLAARWNSHPDYQAGWAP
jgi:hypothetical protein